jgi:RNA polymerase sigma factor (sigma-70 family)
MEGPEVVQGTIEKQEMSSSSVEMIPQYFASDENVEALLRILYIFIRQSGLVRGDHQTVRAMTCELLSDVAAEALTYKERYKPGSSLFAWLCGIAANVVKRKRDRQIKSFQRETPLSLLQQKLDETEGEISLDLFSALAVEGPEGEIEKKEQNAQFEKAFLRLSVGDQRVLRLALQHDLRYDKLAQNLSITQDAARQRYHRATKRLKEIIQEQGSEHNG